MSEEVADTPDQPGARMPEKLVKLRERRLRRCGLDQWPGPAPVMRRLVEQVRLASQVSVPVLLVGEAGTGKQTLARTIHYLGPRRADALAALDCAGLPPETITAFLFGDRGAEREGVAAVYLRQPDRLPRDLQLRLCERLARSGGSANTGPRFLAGCTTAPAEAVRTGRLLDELACLLSPLLIEVPPLRDRRDELPGLVERLLERAGAESETPARGLAADAWGVVRGYSWPGNLAELYAVLRAACVRTGGEPIRAADLPAALRQAHRLAEEPPRPPERPLPLEQLLEQAERRLIELALRRTGGHKARAARLLSIPRPRLFRRMKALGIAGAEEEPTPLEELTDNEEA